MSSFGHDERRGAFFRFRPGAATRGRLPPVWPGGASAVPAVSAAAESSPITVATHDVEAAGRFERVGRADDAESPDEIIPASLRIPILSSAADGRFDADGETRDAAGGSGDAVVFEDGGGRRPAGGVATMEADDSDAGPGLPPPPPPEADGPPSAAPAPASTAPPAASPSPPPPPPPPAPTLCDEEEGAYFDDDRTAASTCESAASTARSPLLLAWRGQGCGVHAGPSGGRGVDDGRCGGGMAAAVGGAGVAGELSSALASCWRGITLRGCCRPPSPPWGSGGAVRDEDEDEEEEHRALLRTAATKRKFDAFVPIAEEGSGGDASGGSEADPGRAERDRRDAADNADAGAGAAAAVSTPAAGRRPAAPAPPSPPPPRGALRPRRSGSRTGGGAVVGGAGRPPPLKFRPSGHSPLFQPYWDDGGRGGAGLAAGEETSPFPEELVFPSMMGS